MASLSQASPRGRWSVAGISAFVVLVLAVLLGSVSPVAATSPPSVFSLIPNRAPLECGVPVELTGTNVGQATGVTFGGKQATIVSRSATKLVVVCPSGNAAGEVDVIVHDAEGTSQAVKFRYELPPTPPSVVEVTPNRGTARGGDRVTIVGSNLAQTTRVTFGVNDATIVAKTATSLEVVTPPGAERTTVDVRVSNPDGTSSPVTFSYDGHIDWIPVIKKITPASGSARGGTKVVIEGINLVEVRQVRFGDVVLPAGAFGSGSGGRLEFTTPPHPPGKIDIRVTAGFGESENTTADDFTVLPDPPARFAYDLSGSASLKALTRGTFSVGGTADLVFDDEGGVSGSIALRDTTARLVTAGVIPLTAKLGFVPTGDAVGSLDDSSGVKLAYSARIKVKELRLFGTLSLVVGANCQTRSAASIPLSASTFDPALGGTLLGTFALSNLTGCGALNGLVSPLTAGTGNLISVKLAPRSDATAN